MKPVPMLAGACLALAVSMPAFAACDDELGALDTRVADKGTTAIAASSSGQGQSAKRDEQAKDARNANVPVEAVPKGPDAGSTEAHATAAAASAGADRVMQAKATINEARIAKGKGDEEGCLAAVAKAKGLLAR